MLPSAWHCLCSAMASLFSWNVAIMSSLLKALWVPIRINSHTQPATPRSIWKVWFWGIGFFGASFQKRAAMKYEDSRALGEHIWLWPMSIWTEQHLLLLLWCSNFSGLAGNGKGSRNLGLKCQKETYETCPGRTACGKKEIMSVSAKHSISPLTNSTLQVKFYTHKIL